MPYIYNHKQTFIDPGPCILTWKFLLI